MTGQKKRFVELLLDTRTMAYRAGRDAVVFDLRDEISRNIQRSDVDKVDCYNIALACLDYPGGLEELIGGIGFFEGNSFAMKRLLAFVAKK